MLDAAMTLDQLWDGGPLEHAQAERRALRAAVASTLLETAGRVRRSIELMQLHGVDDHGPTREELEVQLRLAVRARMPRLLCRALELWVDLVSSVLGGRLDDAPQALAATKLVTDALLGELTLDIDDLRALQKPSVCTVGH